MIMIISYRHIDIISSKPEAWLSYLPTCFVLSSQRWYLENPCHSWAPREPCIAGVFANLDVFFGSQNFVNPCDVNGADRLSCRYSHYHLGQASVQKSTTLSCRHMCHEVPRASHRSDDHGQPKWCPLPRPQNTETSQIRERLVWYRHVFLVSVVLLKKNNRQ